LTAEVRTGRLAAVTAVIGSPTCAKVSEMLSGWSPGEWPGDGSGLVKLVIDATLAPGAEPKEVAELWCEVLPAVFQCEVLPADYESFIGLLCLSLAARQLQNVREQLVVKVGDSPDLRALLRGVGASLEWFLPWPEFPYTLRPLKTLLRAYETIFGDNWRSRVGPAVVLRQYPEPRCVLSFDLP
jgi:hypothetical protein